MLYMIARQEMEHLSVINSLLHALGAPPWFGHDNFQTVSRFHTAAALKAAHHGPLMQAAAVVPCEIPFLLEPFDFRTARRVTCMESPVLADMPPTDRPTVLSWGFHAPGAPCTNILAPSDRAWPAAAAAIDAVEVGTIQELYEAVGQALRQLSATMGEAALFSGAADGSAQTEVPSEYQIFLFRITDLRSSLAAIEMVAQQGEGINGPPGFGSHFSLFLRIAQDYGALLVQSPDFVPHLPLLANPHLHSFDADPVAAEVVAMFHEGYVTLLLMLTGYYGLYREKAFDQPGSYLTAALQYTGFAPLMTMFVRTVAEILTLLPAGDDPNGPRAGPVFDLLPLELHWLATPPSPTNFYGTENLYRQRIDDLLRRLNLLLSRPALPPPARERLVFVLQNMTRLRANLDYVNRQGIYPGFKVPKGPV
jgi:hypothetical protein